MKIGQGLQFNVYKIENKVEKLPTSKTQIKLKLIKWNPLMIFRPSSLEEKANKVIKERESLLKDPRLGKIKSQLLANLEIKDGKIYQDLVAPLSRQLRDYKSACKVLDNYIKFIFECWKNGFSERTYNFTINNGAYKNGKITLIDFGEITFNKEDVEEDIKTGRWERSHTYRWDLNRKVRKYYAEIMRRNITIKNLDDYWKILNH